jgi:hypothetical protein
MCEALDKMLCLIFAHDAQMPRTGELVVCLGRPARKSDFEKGLDEDMAWLIETRYALRVLVQLDLPIRLSTIQPKLSTNSKEGAR